MTEEHTEQLEEKNPNVIEDLTLGETDTANINGGPAYMKLGDIKGDCQR
jgi:hypothetical protein